MAPWYSTWFTHKGTRKRHHRVSTKRPVPVWHWWPENVCTQWYFHFLNNTFPVLLILTKLTKPILIETELAFSTKTCYRVWKYLLSTSFGLFFAFIEFIVRFSRKEWRQLNIKVVFQRNNLTSDYTLSWVNYYHWYVCQCLILVFAKHDAKIFWLIKQP